MTARHLYDSFQPEHYDIFLDINREKKHFSGTSTILGNASDKSIAIHQKGMQIEEVKVNNIQTKFTEDQSLEAIKFDVPQTGEVTVEIVFNAPLTDTMMGIYPSYYEMDGERHEIIGTQFETTSARQAFPSVDEPEAKATFDLAIKYDEKPGEITLANMPENNVEDGVHYFDTTMRMSTYLIAFAFGELQSKETTTKNGTKVGVFTTKAHNINELDLPLDIAKRSIEFYEDFYETPYPLPHSWQLALPDFSAGAMENWGLITYRESYLLFDPDNATMETKLHVATTIAHEVAHQWFGDLVTMKWWDDLWLNESFANMMEYVAVDALEPTWHTWETFQNLDIPRALQRDAIDGVQPVHVHVEDPAEIDALFDSAIVYAKGARMLVMVRALIGDDALRKGLKNYFAAHKYGNATGADLWSALHDASGLDIGGIMNSWLEQPGYPVVNADIVNGDLVLTQQQFFIGQGKDADRIWQIPLNANFDGAPQIMGEKSVNLGNYEDLRQKAGKALRINVGNNSHFIVHYSDTLLSDIMKESHEFDAISKRQILQDGRLLAEGQQITFKNIVPILNAFADSESYLVNDGLYRIVDELKQFVTPDSKEEQNLREYVDKLSSQQVKRLGWVNAAKNSMDDAMTRPYVLKASLFAKNQDSINEAHELFIKFADKLESLPAEIRGLVMKNEMANFGSADIFKQLLTSYQKSSDPAFKADLMTALSSTSDVDQLKELVGDFEDNTIIKPQDLRAWLPAILNNDNGLQIAWDWVQNQWDWIVSNLGGDMSFTGYINSVAGAFKTPERLSEFKKFFEPKIEMPGLKREITMDILSIESRVALIQDQKHDVNETIAKNK